MVPAPLEVGPLIQLGGLGSAVSSPSGVWGKAPAANDFGAILRVKERCWWHSSDYRFCSVVTLL